MRSYIDELNAFYDLMKNADVSPTAALLWYSLMAICNRAHWQTPCPIVMAQIEAASHLNVKTIRKARDELQDIGLIDYETQGANRATLYTMVSIPTTECSPKTECSDVQKRTAVTSKNGRILRQRHKDYINPISLTGNRASDSDKSSIEKHAESEPKPEPKRKPRKKADRPETPDFVRFYDEYPRHDARAEAWKAWAKLSPTSELSAEIIEHVRNRKRGEWKDKDKQYIPMPSTFINQRRWTDEIQASENRIFHSQEVEY